MQEMIALVPRLNRAACAVSRPGHLLIVRVGAMGDVLHALPAVAAWKRLHPESHVGWAIEPRWRALLEDGEGRRPVVDAVHLVRTREWKARPMSGATLRSIVDLRAELRAGRYDVCVDLQGSVRSAVVGRLAGARVLAGAARPRERPARFLYDKAYAARTAHVVEQAAELLGDALGERLEPGLVELPRDVAAEFAVGELLGGVGRFALLAPRAGWGAKQWPAERFGALARALARHGVEPLVNAVDAGDEVARAVVEGSQGAARAVVLTLPELIALTRRAALVVAGDTGPLHLGAALGRPVVALFGPTDPARTGPFGTRARVHRHARSVTDHRRHGAPEEGLLQITTEAVTESALALLGEFRAATGAVVIDDGPAAE